MSCRSCHAALPSLLASHAHPRHHSAAHTVTLPDMLFKVLSMSVLRGALPVSPPMQQEDEIVNHGAEHLKTASSACAENCCCESCTSSWAGLRGVSAASLSASESERGLSIGASAPFAAILGAAKPLLAASQPGKRLKYCAMPFVWTAGFLFSPACRHHTVCGSHQTASHRLQISPDHARTWLTPLPDSCAVGV